jgi:hypothetical protein
MEREKEFRQLKAQIDAGQYSMRDVRRLEELAEDLDGADALLA